MNSVLNTPKVPASRLLYGLAALIIVIAGLKQVQGIIIPFLFATLLAILGTGPVRVLQNWKVPNVIAIVIVALLMLGCLVGLSAIMAMSVNEFALMLPSYRSGFLELESSITDFLGRFGLHVKGSELATSLQPEQIVDIVRRAVGGLIGTVSSIFLVFVLLVLMLLEAASFRLKARIALRHMLDLESVGSIGLDVQRYLAMKTFTSFLTGLLVFLWTEFMGIDFSLLWGLVAFILNYIPFVGSIFASFPALILTAATDGLLQCGLVGIGYMVVNIGVSNFFEPILMGTRLGLSPLVVFLSLIFWGWVWGPAGMLLSVPLTMVAKIVIEHSDEFRWIAILMDSSPKRFVKETQQARG